MTSLTGSALKPIEMASRTEIHAAIQDAQRPGFFARTLSRWMRWHRRRRDEALLMAQPDYMLRDIGLGRSEIEAAVRGEARWRR